MTDTNKWMNPQQFGRDLPDTWIQISLEIRFESWITLVEVLTKWLALAELCCLGTCCYISDWLKYTKNLDNSFSLCLPHTLLNIMPCNCFSAVGISQAWESTWLLITMHSSLLHLIVTSAEVYVMRSARLVCHSVCSCSRPITAEVISQFCWTLVSCLGRLIWRTDWLLVVIQSQVRIVGHCSTSVSIVELGILDLLTFLIVTGQFLQHSTK